MKRQTDNYDHMWKMKTVSYKPNGSYEYDSSTKHSPVDISIVLSFSNTIYQTNAKDLGSELTKFMIPSDIQCSLDLPFFKGRTEKIGECGKTVNRKNNFF
jgi:hypothetical protein